MKLTLKIIIGVFVGLVVFFLATCVGCAGLAISGASEAAEKDSVRKEAIASGEISWAYHTEKDEMGRGETKFATLPSLDDKFTLTIRDSPKFGKDVYLYNEDLWFDTDFSSTSNLKAKFDDGPIKTYSFSGPEGSVDNQAFINDYNGFIKELKAAKKLIIEARFVNQGDVTITFNVANLKWE